MQEGNQGTQRKTGEKNRWKQVWIGIPNAHTASEPGIKPRFSGAQRRGRTATSLKHMDYFILFKLPIE